jgi:acetyl-CoA synthetase
MKTFDSAGEIVWRPPPEIIARSNLRQFMDAHGIVSLEELQRRSTNDIAWFWNAVMCDLGIEFSKPYSEIVDLSGGMAWPRWCVGGEMNIVHNCLDKYAGTPTDECVALKWEGEDGTARALTYAELRRDVNKAKATRSVCSCR